MYSREGILKRGKGYEMSRRSRGKSPGFTLVEIVIVIAVLSLFCILCWGLLSGWMGTSVTGIWRQNANKELGTLSAGLRLDLSKASYPSAVTPEDTVVAAKEDHFIHLKGAEAELPDWDKDDWTDFKVVMAGPGKAGAFSAAEETVLEIIQGTPGKTRIPGFPDSPVKATKITYFLKGGESIRGKGKYCQAVKNLWRREESGTVEADSFTVDSTFSYGDGRTRKLIQGVNCVLMGVSNSSLSGDKSEVTSSPAVKIKVLCVEPHKGKAKLSVTVTANGQTGVKFGT